MRTLLIVLVLASTAFGFTSPAGHTFTLPERMFIDEPLYLPGEVIHGRAKIIAKVGEMLDTRIAECKAKHAGLSQDVLAKADIMVYRVKNSWTFPCGDASPSGYCAGLTDVGRNIWAALYTRGQWTETDPATFYAPFTYISNYELWRRTGIQGWYDTRQYVNWGTTNGTYLPAVCHELEVHIWNAGTASMEEGVPFKETGWTTKRQ